MNRSNSRLTCVGIPAISACFAGGLLAGTPQTVDPEAVVPEDEVNAQALLPFLKAAFLKCEVMGDGAIKVEEDGIKTFIKVDPSKKLIAVFSLWRVKAAYPDAAKLGFVNRLNKTLIVVRFHIHNATTLVCDYQFPYENGIRPSTLVGAYRLFAKVVKGAVLTQDPDRIIGPDDPLPIPAAGQGV